MRQLSTEGNWASLKTQLEGFAADGLILERPPVSQTDHYLRLPTASLLVGDEGDQVVIQDCWFDDLVQRTVDGVIVDQQAEVKLMTAVMVVDDGLWRVAGVARATPESDGFDQCRDVAQQVGLPLSSDQESDRRPSDRLDGPDLGTSGELIVSTEGTPFEEATE